MTQEQKDLLIKDLCSRLPYGVKVLYDSQIKELQYIEPVYDEVKLLDYTMNYTVGIEEIKPCLFPCSSMTEEQKEEHQDLINNHYNFDANGNVFTLQDFYCKYHFDYRGLIPMDLANDATNKNIY